MDFLFEYLSFLAQSITILIVILIVIGSIASLKKSNQDRAAKNSIKNVKIKSLSEEYKDIKSDLLEKILNKKELKKLDKQKKEKKKKEKEDNSKGKVFVLEFNGNMKASGSFELAQCVSCVIAIADKEKDEILVKVESPGGIIHEYGYAASQLQRIRNANIHLTVAVDKVAASGGYMMACIGKKIISAPFAIVGSIGVVAQMPNFHRFLQDKKIDYDVITAGDHKRTMTVFGENTSEDREKFEEDLQNAHDLFKGFISKNRPQVEIDKVANGKYWFGVDAIGLNLIDKIQNSDDYIVEQMADKKIYSLSYKTKKSLALKISGGVSMLVNSLFSSLKNQNQMTP